MDFFSLSGQLTEHSACMAALRLIETRVLDAGRVLCAAIDAGRKVLIGISTSGDSPNILEAFRIQEAHIFILHFWASCIDGYRPGNAS